MNPKRWWDARVVPRLVDVALSESTSAPWRARVCSDESVRGEVLEIGFGSGANLPMYGDDVTSVLAVEPADLAWERSAGRVRGFGRPVERIGLDAAVLSLPEDSVDAVVSTWTLCTVPRLQDALGELARVLRPGGVLRFVEHTASSRRPLRQAQRAVQPVWGFWAGGCHLDRDILGELETADFRLTDLSREGWFVSGTARVEADTATPRGEDRLPNA